jgi:hypothetical protein
MNTPLLNDHPDDVTLDKLRAGLVSGDNTALQTHVGGCTACQQRLSTWDRLASGWHTGTPPRPTLARQLRERRQRALAGQGVERRGAHHREPRYFALAAAIGVVTIGLSIFMVFDRFGVDTPPVGLSAQVERAPDFYADIDFYLWLARQAQTKGTNGNAS